MRWNGSISYPGRKVIAALIPFAIPLIHSAIRHIALACCYACCLLSCCLVVLLVDVLVVDRLLFVC